MNPRLKKIGRNILFLLSIPLLLAAFVFANANRQDETCEGIHVDIENPSISFITIPEVEAIISGQGVSIRESIVRDIEINNLEKTILKNKWVHKAEIYVSANHWLHVKVKQKVPHVRIMQTDSSDYAYYLDEYANPIELSRNFSAKVQVVTAPKLGYTRKDLNLKQDLVVLSNYIHNDTFWNAMITQISVDPAYEIELIPAIGEQVIRLGNIDHLDSKMKRLLAFYQQGLQTVDWSKYNEIDLRFNHQVIARNTNIDAFPEKVIMTEKDKNHMKHSGSKLIAQAKVIPTNKDHKTIQKTTQKDIVKKSAVTKSTPVNKTPLKASPTSNIKKKNN